MAVGRREPQPAAETTMLNGNVFSQRRLWSAAAHSHPAGNDALQPPHAADPAGPFATARGRGVVGLAPPDTRSEEHTSELQSQ